MEACRARGQRGASEAVCQHYGEVLAMVAGVHREVAWTGEKGAASRWAMYVLVQDVGECVERRWNQAGHLDFARTPPLS